MKPLHLALALGSVENWPQELPVLFLDLKESWEGQIRIAGKKVVFERLPMRKCD